MEQGPRKLVNIFTKEKQKSLQLFGDSFYKLSVKDLQTVHTLKNAMMLILI